jgi:hypothetical protein
MMTSQGRPVSKTELEEYLARAWAVVETWIAGLSDEQRAQPAALDRWGAKATLAHIAHWNMALLKSLDLKAGGSAVPWQWEDMDGQNARLLEECSARAWADVAGEAQATHAALRARLAQLGGADLQAADDFAWQDGGPLWLTFLGNAYFHLLEHVAGAYEQSSQPAAAAALRSEIDEANRKAEDT